MDNLREKTVQLEKCQSRLAALQSELEVCKERVVYSENKFHIYITKARKVGRARVGLEWVGLEWG